MEVIYILKDVGIYTYILIQAIKSIVKIFMIIVLIKAFIEIGLPVSNFGYCERVSPTLKEIRQKRS